MIKLRSKGSVKARPSLSTKVKISSYLGNHSKRGKRKPTYKTLLDLLHKTLNKRPNPYTSHIQELSVEQTSENGIINVEVYAEHTPKICEFKIFYDTTGRDNQFPLAKLKIEHITPMPPIKKMEVTKILVNMARKIMEEIERDNFKGVIFYTKGEWKRVFSASTKIISRSGANMLCWIPTKGIRNELGFSISSNSDEDYEDDEENEEEDDDDGI